MENSKSLGYILVVDDDKASNYLAQILLEDMGLTSHIQTFINSKEALQFVRNLYLNHTAQNEPPGFLHLQHFIFLDINMPEMSGFEFIEELRKLQPLRDLKVEVVMLTSSSYYEDVEKASTYQVTKFLEKPLTEEKILQVFENE